MKSLLITTLLIFSTSSVFAKDTNTTKKPKSEFMQKILAMKKRQQDAKAKTKAVEELRKSVDKLANTTNELSKTLGTNNK